MAESARKSSGLAHVKAQYIIQRVQPGKEVDDDLAERETNPAATEAQGKEEDQEQIEDAASSKRIKLSGAARKKARKEEESEKRKAHRGQNKGRKFVGIRDQITLCNFVARGIKCDRKTCLSIHSIKEYLLTKPTDVFLPCPPVQSQKGSLYELSSKERDEYLDLLYLTTPPFVKFGRDETKGGPSIDLETCCPVLASQRASSSSKKLLCYAGWSCRFLGGHIRKVGDSEGVDGTEWQLSWSEECDSKKEDDNVEGRRNAPDELNWPAPGLIKSLNKRAYPYYLTKSALKHLDREKQLDIKAQGATAQSTGRGPIYIDEEAAKQDFEVAKMARNEEEDMDALMNEKLQSRIEDAVQSTSLVDMAKLKPSEKRRLDWFHDELYLAPLTTTGNLPFRRLCSSLGADITCGEMGLAECYLQGQKNEWSLVRRWEGERCFGTQLCGNKPELLVPAAELLARQFPTGLDFIDVNCGCPIDLVYNKGAGSALLDHPSKLGRIVRGMAAVSGDIPITIKLRTGTASSSPTTLKFFPKIKPDWNASAVTLHGRTRQQRYKSLADWDYIRQCTSSLRESIAFNNEERPDEEWVHPIPIYGNGDVFSWQDYQYNKTLTGVDGQMLARGALIKPWLFTEIKEKRDWDISSRERLDLIRQLTSYGLCHWGSDTHGLNTTRRFVCESLSFTHRYIPLGILEHNTPAKLNERPPSFKGRDELETLLSSGNANDWVKITEMFLGKAPPEFQFLREFKV